MGQRRLRPHSPTWDQTRIARGLSVGVTTADLHLSQPIGLNECGFLGVLRRKLYLIAFTIASHQAQGLVKLYLVRHPAANSWGYTAMSCSITPWQSLRRPRQSLLYRAPAAPLAKHAVRGHTLEAPPQLNNSLRRYRPT